MCMPLTVCSVAEYESVAPTANSDRECTALTVCTAEEYEARTPTATRDRVCRARNTQVSAGGHRIEWTQMFDREVTDGLDDDGDGVLNTYGPGVVTYGCTIIISE